MIFHELLHLYCNRASAIEANNKIMKETEAFVKKNNTTQKRPKKKVNITKSIKSMGIFEEAVKYVTESGNENKEIPIKITYSLF